jgi:sec-independent protein translocase protein TatB
MAATGWGLCYESGMLGLGFGEVVIVLVLALVLLGPKRLPDVAKQLGKAMREFRRATEDLKGQFETELYREEPKAPPPALAPRSSPPAEPTIPVPAARTDNVPGLEAAAAEPVTPPQGQDGKPTEST